jgi:hypothetical protein
MTPHDRDRAIGLTGDVRPLGARHTHQEPAGRGLLGFEPKSAVTGSTCPSEIKQRSET